MTDYSGSYTGTVGTDNLSDNKGGPGGVALAVSNGSSNNLIGYVYGVGYSYVTGGAGGHGDYSGGSGGIGVDLSNSSTLNSIGGQIRGGKGGYGGGSGPLASGGTGGVGVAVGSFSELTNSPKFVSAGHIAFGTIVGGNGGDGQLQGGAGGAGVTVSSNGTLTNDSRIRGGNGGSGDLRGGSGGAGVEQADGGTVTSNSVITGGAGGLSASDGGDGGIGVKMGDSGVVINSSNIRGGDGGGSDLQGGTGGIGVELADGGTVINNGWNITGGAGGQSAGDGGDGGIGVKMSDSGAVQNDGDIYGGHGGSGDLQGGTGGTGVELADGGTVTNNDFIKGGKGGQSIGDAGDGGIGVKMGDSGIVINNDTIHGGVAGDSDLQGANGGIGVELADGGTVTNNGFILGGSANLQSGTGGTGIELVDGGMVTNNSTISGGLGGLSAGGGIGVNITGSGIVINNGAILGGYNTIFGGTHGDAVRFGAGDAWLIVAPGGTFAGAVKATAAFDNTVELRADGGAQGSIDFDQFSGFDRLQLDSGAFWVVDGAVGADMEVQLLGTGDRLGIGALEVFDATIEGFSADDEIGIRDFSEAAGYTGSSFDYGSGLLTIITASGAFTLDFADPASFTGLFFNVISDGTGFGLNITLEATPCYCPGTLIQTDRGEVPVEELAIGDWLITLSGEHEPIRWIGRRGYGGRFLSGKRDILPVRIKADALADGVPRRDLIISPLHAMYIDGALIPAGELVDGVSIVQENVDQVEYIHIELAAHDVIWAEGAPSETFLDDDSRGMFHNADEYARLYPEAERKPAQYCAPRLTEGYALDAIRRRIAQRAGLTHTATPAALRGVVDFIGRATVHGWAQDPAHPEAPVCLDILVNGKPVAQVLANQYRADLQQAGLGSGRHAFVLHLPAGVKGAIEVRRVIDQQPLANASYRTAA